ncbi:MAG: SBBP repeat-containing protein, partial [Sandaracinaceae bacterium]|nr:SBBP repeat-containing protein [Sandaracinaceae bacterium]
MKRAWAVGALGLGWACSAEPAGLTEVSETGPRAAQAEAVVAEVAAAEAQPAAEGEARRRFGQLPMRYERNDGQHDARAHYVARQGALTLFATDEGPVLSLRVPEAPQAGEAPDGALGPVRPGLGAEADGPAERREPPPSRLVGLRIALEGARAGAPIEAGEPLVTRSNYFLGDDPSAWRTDIPNYGSLRYRELAPGVDLVLRGSLEGRIEYDFVVAPGTSPELSVRFEGAERVTLGEGGTLEVHAGGAVLEQPPPVLYQEVGGRRVPVEGGYRVVGLDRVRFEVGEYDRSLPLVIDPVLVYGTYLGGSGFDRGWGIAVDGAGAAYVTGYTTSTDFPTLSPAQGALAGGGDAFVAKLNATGTGLVYATYLGGGSNTEEALGIAVDGAGAAYVTGYTFSTNFPTLSPAQAANAGGGDAFVTKLSAAGALAYSTYLGGSGTDYGYGIAVDGAGAAYVTGYTTSTNFPTLSPAQAANAGGADAFVTKLSAAGALAYSTYLGGSNTDVGRGIAVDGAGAAYVTGETFSSNFPTLSPAQAANAGGGDAFVTKLSAAGALAYSTYLGGSSSDYGWGIAVDGAGAAYVTGYTGSSNFPTLSPAQAANAGGWDAFVTKLSAAGALAYSTYLGGSGSDFGRGIAVDGAGAAYVTGETSSIDFPATAGAFRTTTAGGGDAFVAKLGPDGAANGTVCTADSECASGFCTDGRCCNVRCGGGTSDCQACSVAAGAAANGTCGPTSGNACTDTLACTVSTTCSSGTCGGGSSPCFSSTTCSEAGGGDYTCSACPAGTFSADGTGRTACTACAAGTWSSAGATSCTAFTVCAPGTYVSSAGSATSDRQCTACAAGTYSTVNNATSCTAWSNCAAGTYVSTAGTSTNDRACTSCAAGSYTSTANQTSCSAWTSCAAGTYVSTAGSATNDRTCTSCAAGSYTSTANQTSCSAWTSCAAGT